MTDTKTITDDVMAIMPAEVRESIEADRAKGPHPCAGGCGCDVELSWDKCQSCSRADEQREAADHRTRVDGIMRRKMLGTIPESLAWASFDFPQLSTRVPASVPHIRAAKVAASAMAAGKIRRIVLQSGEGLSGVGKTTLAICIFREVVSSWPIRKLVDDRARERDDAISCFVDCFEAGLIPSRSRLGDEPEELEAFKRAPLIVLDDVGAERGANANATIAEIIRSRQARDMCMIVTAGFSAEELGKTYGNAVVRRMFDQAAKITWKAGA